MAQAHHPRLLAQPQDLNKQILKSIEVAAPELADASVVGLLISDQHLEVQFRIAFPLDFKGRDRAHAVGVEQEHGQHARGKPLRQGSACAESAPRRPVDIDPSTILS